MADIACGTGYGICELRRTTCHVVGVDANHKALEAAASRSPGSDVRLLEKRLGVDDLLHSLGRESLNAIVSFETLEHLVDPGATLRQFADLLSKGGFLICSVPNAEYENQDHAGLPKNQDHKLLFRYSSLTRMLERHSFKIEYRLGQPWTNKLLKRETHLVRRKVIEDRPSNEPSLHFPETVRRLSYLLAYPTTEDADASYSIIVVARKA